MMMSLMKHLHLGFSGFMKNVSSLQFGHFGGRVISEVNTPKCPKFERTQA